ncbi:peptide chain release factor N(5)-glutamine methyltransferase [Dyadobacter sandarakinus]|uniref:peptide chain release factor N(5)-glutamine methyltransferase n=1 Tax=Dyadobacter sandarakinus TaxID=2747268 RepID=A0ABX7IBM9_9BACT|nr:peptide chain release factor N(5)-glutamine methyltransferase [Dyadobacter sandarakinus]QRR02331.1 peptide chain release factor N(5)-glutamine methyltransferase [Dyadobacter sandarakinus]
MTSARQLYQHILKAIQVYPEKEAQAITFMLLEHYMRLRNIDVLVDRPIPPTTAQPDWESIISRLNNNEPVQHIIGSTEFCGLEFRVSSSVLIPRPETEELVRMVTRDYAEPDKDISILDIGTGSGCIAIVLARFLPHVTVHAWDVSDEALEVARENARQLIADVKFAKQDMLNVTFPLPGDIIKFDCLVSNPPYVTYSEQEHMRPNVLRFEPQVALFVEDSDPLLFYKAIADFGVYHLKENGKCYVEINEHFGPGTKEVFEERNYKNVEILRDINGKDRFVRAIWAS